MKTTTAREMFNFLEQVVHDGHGDAELLFDTEARKFDYHMAQVGDSYLETEAFDRPIVTLHELKQSMTP